MKARLKEVAEDAAEAAVRALEVAEVVLHLQLAQKARPGAVVQFLEAAALRGNLESPKLNGSRGSWKKSSAKKQLQHWPLSHRRQPSMQLFITFNVVLIDLHHTRPIYVEPDGCCGADAGSVSAAKIYFVSLGNLLDIYNHVV